MISAILWDLDGVIVESETYFIRHEIKLLKKYDVDLTPEIASQYLGLRLEDYISALAKRFRQELPVQEISEAMLREIDRLYRVEIPLVPHAKRVLRDLSKRYKMAVVTSRERKLADYILRKFGLGEYLKAIVAKEDVTRAKPDPEGYLAAAKKLGVQPTAAVVIEDAVNGFQAAHAAGMKVIGRKAAHNRGLDFSLANYTVTDLLQIPKIVQ